MNAVKITQTLKQTLVDYLMTTFDANKDGQEPELARKIRESFEAPRALFMGPYLELIKPYTKAGSLCELCNDGILSPKLLTLSCFSRPKPEPIPLDTQLYAHQAKAIHKLSKENRSIVLSSGTGSGKTEGFSIPIVNDLLLDPSPGVRALLVYPLNALVNDQMERLRVMLNGTHITFARFTSELPTKFERDDRWLPNEILSREEIRKDGRIPQILITNYAMLEYLLFRPEDSVIFSKPETWKYIVLDEAHTYSGAQGIEVAMLIRRLKQRLGKKKGQMLCVATSATLVDENPQEAVAFAQNLFDENFAEDDIIFGKEQQKLYNSNQSLLTVPPGAYLHYEFEDLLKEMHKEASNDENAQNVGPDVEDIALRLFDIGLIDSDGLSLAEKFSGDLPAYLFEVLSGNPQLTKLRSWMIEQNHPVLFDDAAAYIFPSFDQQDRAKALYHLIELGSAARPAPSHLPLLPAKYHIFARPPQGTWACLNPNCPGKESEQKTKWSRIYSNPTNRCESCGAQVYPVHLCRECGQAYIACHYINDKSTYLPAIEHPEDGNEKRYFTWSVIKENSSLADISESGEEAEEESDEDKLKYLPYELKICLQCGRHIAQCSCSNRIESIPLYEIRERKMRKSRGRISETPIPVSNLNECPRCHSKSKKESEVVTPVKIAGNGPLANLTYELYRELPPASDQKKKTFPGGGRKLLTFYDSRQGAARFAAFLQDVSNRQNYRHIVPLAIEQCLQPHEWGANAAPDIYRLSTKCAEIALKNGIPQNDPDIDLFGENPFSITTEGRRRAALRMAGVILGEFTTGRRSRQSLESMGLVGISYFEKGKAPNCENLALKIGLSEVQVKALVAHLLDDLRYEKAIELPEGILPDSEEFGANKGNPSYIRQGNPSGREVRWIGVTPRHKRRQYIKKVLEENQLDSSDTAIINTLNEIWGWMISLDGLFTGTRTKGYQLNLKHIFFERDLSWFRCKKCQRLSYRGTSIPCPIPGCGGSYEPVTIDTVQSENYYYNLFNQSLIPLRIEEHTAQLESEKGKEYQNLFKGGRINVLSCSTTFEMGIDLGDLQAVVMNNVPPTVANYRQRAGRAGRRTSGTAYILTWTSDRPHDQAYYDDPIEIISGQVRVPKIMLENELIVQRHVNALLISRFLRYRKDQGVDSDKLTFCGGFFDTIQSEDPEIDYLDEWIEAENRQIQNELSQFAVMVPEGMQPMVRDGLNHFITDLRKLNDEHYQPITRYYREQIQSLTSQLGDTSIVTNKRDIQRSYGFFENLLSRMRGSKDRRTGYLIDYLSSRGIMPSYSFPLSTVELLLPKEAKNGERLRLERDLRLAIKEYAPGSEIVADKKIWKSDRPIFWRDTPRVQDYRICEYCHHLLISDDAGIPLKNTNGHCPVCKGFWSGKSRTRKFVEPDGFIADPKSGKPAKQYVKIQQSQMRSALIPEQNLDEVQHSKYINLAYNQKGRLLYINEGKFGQGFSISTQGFSLLSENKNREQLSLGFIQTTNTLRIRFVSHEELPVPRPEDQSTWLSLLYALIHGASHSLQIEREDIDGVLFPTSSGGSWQQTIVLYDNVPGGAGHVKTIKENLSSVLNEARRILNCNDCAPDTSCYHCLRDYNNQYFHQELKRDSALKFLDQLISSQEPLDIGVPGAVKVVAPDYADWLLEKIRYSERSLAIAVQKLTTGHPLGENYTWLDTLGDLLNKGVEVELHVQELPLNSSENFSLANHLQVLMNKGLKVWKTESLPRWQVVIDRDALGKRAIRSLDEDFSIILDGQIGTDKLVTSTQQDAIKTIQEEWNALPKKIVSRVELNPPPNIKVINVGASAHSNISEQTLFSDFFTKPCRKMVVHDPYLFTRDVIVNRLGKYITMASQHDTLEEVIVQTKLSSDVVEQKAAQKELIGRHAVPIRFERETEHDRFIEVTRMKGEKAKIIIGRGLDFIQPDGSTKPTYIIIQDPMPEKKGRL